MTFSSTPNLPIIISGGNHYYYYVSDQSRKQIAKATAAAKDYYFTNRTVVGPNPLTINNNTTTTTTQPLVYNTPRSSTHLVDRLVVPFYVTMYSPLHSCLLIVTSITITTTIITISNKDKNAVIGSIDGTTATSTAARKQSQHPQHPHPQLPHPQPQLPQPQPQNKQYPDLSRRKGLVSAKQQSTDESYPTTKAKSATAMAASTNKHTINQPPLDLSTMTDPFPQPPEGVSILQTGRPPHFFE